MTAHQRWLEQPTAEDDDTTELLRRERLAQAVRESTNEVDRLIVEMVESSSWVEYSFPAFPSTRRMRTRTADEENLLISDASRIGIIRSDDHKWWNEANGAAMCRETPDVIEILGLLASGSDNCRLGELMVNVTRKAFAEACVSAAEDLYP